MSNHFFQKPRILRRVVVFPAPLIPTNPVIQPSGRSYRLSRAVRRWQSCGVTPCRAVLKYKQRKNYCRRYGYIKNRAGKTDEHRQNLSAYGKAANDQQRLGYLTGNKYRESRQGQTLCFALLTAFS